MKNYRLIMIQLFIIVSCLTNQSYGLGISPGRTTFMLPENSNEIESEVEYLLFPGQERYSVFKTLAPLGLNVANTGCDITTGVEYLPDGSMQIDWDIVTSEIVRAYVEVSSPDDWQHPAEPGGNTYYDELVQYYEHLGSDPISVINMSVSQIAIRRNYALRTVISDLQESYITNNPVQFQLEVTDYASYETYLDSFRIAYEIDWESDGLVDESHSGLLMTGEQGQTDPFDRCTGYKYKWLDFEHTFDVPGEYIISINLSDRWETTPLQVPIHVIPEPMTLILLGFGCLFLNRKSRIYS